MSGRDLRLAFLGLERAGGIDEPAARLEQGRGVVEQPRLEPGKRLDVLRPTSDRGCRDGGGWCRSTSRAHRAAPHRIARPGCQVAASPTTSSAFSPSRSRLSRKQPKPRLRSCRPQSPRRRQGQAAPSCRRARRKDRRPACPPRRRAGAPAGRQRRPAPTTRPHRNRAAPRCVPWAGACTLPVGSTRPDSRSAQSAGSLFTVRSSGGSTRCAAAIACARASPQ